MKEAISFAIRKNRTVNIVSVLFVFGIIPSFGIGVNLFMKGSPMEFMNPYFWFFGIGFLLLALYIFVKHKDELVIQEGDNGEFTMVKTQTAKTLLRLKD